MVGGVLSESVNRGSVDSPNLHINVLELLAIKLALLTFSKIFNGGYKEMITISKEILEFTMPKEIMLTVEYLLGRLNVRADWASRNFQDSSEWLLSLF